MWQWQIFPMVNENVHSRRLENFLEKKIFLIISCSFAFVMQRLVAVRVLTLSWWRPLSYRNQSTDLLRKSMDWFLYDNGLRHERVNKPWEMTYSVIFPIGSPVSHCVYTTLGNWNPILWENGITFPYVFQSCFHVKNCF